MPVDATPSLLSLAPGTYTIRERAKPSASGRWRLVHASCNGIQRSTTRSFQVEIHSGQSIRCTFVNVFTPRGSISIAKITQGSTGTTAFLISPTTGTPTQYLQHATTTTEGVPSNAEPATASDATDHLRLASYLIVESLPPGKPAGGGRSSPSNATAWLRPLIRGTVQVRLTRKQPHVRCVFVNAFTSNPPPEPPTPPTPPPTPPSPPAPPPPPITDAVADLVVVKHASPSVIARMTASPIRHLIGRPDGATIAYDVAGGRTAQRPRIRGCCCVMTDPDSR